MNSCKSIFLALSILTLCLDSSLFTSAAQVTYDGGNLLIDGVPRIILSGSIHYPRSTVQMWPDLIQKSKQGGLDTIETYIFWDRHEPHRRQYDFYGNLDFIRFLKTVQAAGMYAILRIGPYVCAEWTYGGFPMWLHNLPGVELRTDNQVYKEEMQNFTTLIVNMCKKEKLFASQGGPIILSQIENEYGSVQKNYGEAGKSYVKWCAQMAESLNIGVPWIMCVQPDAPAPVINACNGFYCDTFTPNNSKIPKIWTENWTGWFKSWNGPNPHRPAEDLAFAVARFYQAGGAVQNYYMYHGGTNFGHTAGGPYITTSYDYDAPLDEYGNLNQPKWGHLKKLHEVLKSAEKILTQKSATEKQIEKKLCDKAGNGSICFLSNSANGSSDSQVDLQADGKFTVPAWSVSVLTDCKTEVYNTAKVNTQTSVMVKKPSSAENEQCLWKAEPLKDTLRGKGGTSNSTQLLEQKAVAVDASDYLWYMTSFNVGTNDFPKDGQMTLRVNTTGPVLHAYVNQERVGSQWGKEGNNSQFVFEKPIKLKPGKNDIVLLSASIGFTNYGPFFDLKPVGIVGGPVQLLGTGSSTNTTKDLSSNLWSYKVGLNGENQKFYDANSHKQHHWSAEGLPVNKPMTWYKTTFQAPLGRDPVTVDLKGMGKGHAWVNGRSIGRFWPAFLAQENGCSDTCDYRGKYRPDKCQTNCGNITQRWYHVPRSFLNDGENNTLVLFEEMGGNPTQVNFQTVTIGKVCANVYEGNTLELGCQGGKTISVVEFASYGDPQGTCESFKKGTCEADNSLSVVQKACVGKESCSINVTGATFGSSKCGGNNISKQACVEKESCSINVTEATFGSCKCGGNNISKRLAVQAVC